jgi:hypothetical protein
VELTERIRLATMLGKRLSQRVEVGFQGFEQRRGLAEVARVAGVFEGLGGFRGTQPATTGDEAPQGVGFHAHGCGVFVMNRGA